MGKTRNKDEEVEAKTLFPKSLFFDFPNPRKNTKSNVNFKTQNFFLIAAKTLVRSENKLSKFLVKTVKRTHLYSHLKN